MWLFDGDLSDLSSLIRIMHGVRPEEIYNLARSFVKPSWQQPLLTGGVTGLGCVHALRDWEDPKEKITQIGKPRAPDSQMSRRRLS